MSLLHIAGLVFLGVSTVLFGLAATGNPDGRLTPAGGAFLAVGELCLHAGV